MTTLTQHKLPNEFFKDDMAKTEAYDTSVLMGNGISIKNTNSDSNFKPSFWRNLKKIISGEKNDPIVFIDYWIDLKPISRRFSTDIPCLDFPLFNIEEDFSETNSLLYAQSFLTTLSNKFQLGDVKLIMEDEDSCLPTFNIITPNTLSAVERIELSDKLFDSIYYHYEKTDRLKDFKNFFFRLDFEE